MMFLYQNENGKFLNYIVKGDKHLGTIIEINLDTQHIKLSTWDVQYAHFDNGTNLNGTPKGITFIKEFPDIINKNKVIKFVFDEMFRSSLW